MSTSQHGQPLICYGYDPCSCSLPTRPGLVCSSLNEGLRIAQISTLVEPVTESSKNGLSQIVYYLTQELVDLGHDVTLYAPMSSSTNGRLVALTDLDTAAETILGKVLPVAAAFADWRDFDIIHDHTRFYSTLFAHLLSVPIVSTVHHPAEFDELHWNYPHDQYTIYFKAIWQRACSEHEHSLCKPFSARWLRGKSGDDL